MRGKSIRSNGDGTIIHVMRHLESVKSKNQNMQHIGAEQEQGVSDRLGYSILGLS
jgi:hypothetical protein